MKRLLLLQAGTAQRELWLRTGDYHRWFLDSLPLDLVQVTRVCVHLGERLPKTARDFDGVLMTGSPLSMTRPEAWMLRAGEWMLEASEQGTPVLGVCFGHQLLGHLLGSRVVLNPAGREAGAVEIELTKDGREDALFAGVSPRFWANATHEDVVATLPPGARLLASNPNTRVQSFAWGRRVRGVQFHPELSTAGTRALLDVRKDRLVTEARARGLDPLLFERRLFSQLHAATPGKRILRNFAEGL